MILARRRTALALLGWLLLAACTVPDPSADTASVASYDGVPITYDVRGDGPLTLVLVHGWSCDRGYWRDQVEALSSQFRVVTLDLGGHGDSGLDRQRWTISSFGADVAAVVEDLGLSQVVLVGHSMGGDVIVEAARRFPDLVEGMIWIDTYSQLGLSRSAAEIDEIVAPFQANFVETTRSFVRAMFPPDADPALVERVANDMSAAPPEVALDALTSSLGYAGEVTAALATLGIPLVSVNPEGASPDVASLREHGVGEVHLVPGVGHFLMMEQPAEFNRRWCPARS